MRPVKGFDRPPLQWAFVACSLVLIAMAVAETVILRRVKAERDAARVGELNGRLDKQQLEIVLARERSAREALSMEVGRRNAATPPDSVPTLTLVPLRTRAATPPQPTMDVPQPVQVIELRLQLPGVPDPRLLSYTAALRRWSTGEILWTRSGLIARTADGRALVSAYVTGDLFSPGPYEVELTGVAKNGPLSEIASYEVAVRPPR